MAFEEKEKKKPIKNWFRRMQKTSNGHPGQYIIDSGAEEKDQPSLNRPND